ncbi:MAG: hypothetical protein OXH93_12900 [Caldilineaceae bacterium]|nr:hypothetical protein [Caldilineaceae bacterium]
MGRNLCLILVSLLLSACGALRASDPYYPPVTPVADRTFEEWLGLAREVPHDDLFQDPDRYLGEIVRFTGEIQEVIVTESDTRLQIAVTWDEAWEDFVFVRYRGAAMELARGQVVSFVGRVNGTIDYIPVSGRMSTSLDISSYAIQVEAG